MRRLPHHTRSVFSPARFRLLASSVLLVAGTGLIPMAGAQVAPVPPVNTRDRDRVVDFYRHYYLPSNHVPPGWTGSVTAGAPGALSPGYLRATLRRINYFRAMSGLPGNVVFDAAHNARCQQAALMMAAAGRVSHAPASSWKFYTRAAAATAAHANLNLNRYGDQGPGAIDRYMDDPGARNASVGHRRWLLCPATRTMGTGVVPAAGGSHPGANVTWVSDGTPPVLPVTNGGGHPAVVKPVGSWPPPGFVPAAFLYDRWSFSLPGADFRHATVRVSKEGRSLPVARERPRFQSAADGSGAYLGANTLVWSLPGNAVSRGRDETYRVQVADVRVAGEPREFTYSVTSIDLARRGRLDAPTGEHGRERLAGSAAGIR